MYKELFEYPWWDRPLREGEFDSSEKAFLYMEFLSKLMVWVNEQQHVLVSDELVGYPGWDALHNRIQILVRDLSSLPAVQRMYLLCVEVGVESLHAYVRSSRCDFHKDNFCATWWARLEEQFCEPGFQNLNVSRVCQRTHFRLINKMAEIAMMFGEPVNVELLRNLARLRNPHDLKIQGIWVDCCLGESGAGEGE